jgi:hypothetical protein
MIKVPLVLQYQLRMKPEYAMGYQYGEVLLSSGGKERGFILNGRSFVTRDELSGLSPIAMARAENEAMASSLEITEVKLIPRSLESMKAVRRISATDLGSTRKIGAFSAANEAYRASKGAIDASITLTKEGEIFCRFSAFRDDFRITEHRALTPGTFATTKEDADKVKTGREAISRYALENKNSANNRFTITPEENTELQEGIVQPAYGETGGGIEVIFVKGTTKWTVSQPEVLPE